MQQGEPRERDVRGGASAHAKPGGRGRGIREGVRVGKCEGTMMGIWGSGTVSEEGTNREKNTRGTTGRKSRVI